MFYKTLLTVFTISLLLAPAIWFQSFHRAIAQAANGTEILSLASEKCVDVRNGSVDSEADVRQYTCHQGPNQKWIAHNASTPGYVYFVNQNSGLCLDVRIGGPRDGSLQQYTCHYRDNQLFRLDPQTDATGGVRIVAKHSGNCLDVPGSSADDRIPIQQYPCHAGINQRWIYADKGPYHFQVTATPIGRETLTLREGHSYSFTLTGLSHGATPLMHLWSSTHGNVTPLRPPIARVENTKLIYDVGVGKGGKYTLFVHAAPATSAGSGTLTISEDNAVMARRPNFPIGGVTVDVPASDGVYRFRYETAMLPGGVDDTFILALDNRNYLKGYDDDSGVGRTSRITGPPGTMRIVVGTGDRSTGSTMLYANDIFRDLDRDGLGYALERDLGTCDVKGALPQCAAVFNLADTDRDGLEDNVEVFGLEDGNLFFPKWGANPRHKDLFVEADWTSEFVTTPLNQDRIRRMQYHLARGPAAQLVNLDGRDGISLHVDAGIDPTDPADRTLYGAWGGANRVTSWNANSPPASFDSRRLNFFHHLLLVRGGGSNGFGRYWYATGEDPDTIMHEFGHTLGLQHERVVPGPANPIVQGLNCSPAYPSIMSYATPHASFISGDGFPPGGINPSSLCEADGLGSGITDLSFITDSLGGIPVDSVHGQIDWNRDGNYSGTATLVSGSKCRPSERVRAVVNWGYSGCDAHIQGGFVLSPEDGTGGRSDGGDLLGGPSMTRAGSRLYVFYVKRDAAGSQRLFYQSAVIGPKTTAGCTDGFKVYTNGNTDRCMTFNGPFQIATVDQGRASAAIIPSRVAVFSLADGVQVAMLDSAGQLRLFSLTTAELEAGLPSRIVRITPALRTTAGSIITSNSDLALAAIRLDRTIFAGSGRHLALYYVDSTGAVRWASKELGSNGLFVDRGALVDSGGTPLATSVGDSPALASWTSIASGDDLDLYLVLQQADARMRLYRYDVGHDRWTDITQATFGSAAIEGPGHNQKIAFWFQPLLDGNGEIIEPGKGFFSILFRFGTAAAGAATPSTPSMWRSDDVSQSHAPSQFLHFGVFQKFGHDWYSVRGNNYPIGLGGGFAVYHDDTMPGLKAVLLKTQDNGKHDLMFLPFADGIFDMAFKPSEDFKVMEATLCRSMRGSAFCGGPTQTTWGY